MAPLLDGLNAAQRAAAECLDGPVLILAGAGSGKTRTLTHRAAYLLEQKRCHPTQLLVLTFTNKAAGELRARLGALLSPEEARQVWAMTFHAVCVRILRRSAGHIGLDNNFTIVDSADSRKLLKQAAININDSAAEDNDELKRVRAIISRGKNAAEGPASLTSSSDHFFVRVGRLWAEYDRLLRELSGLDFDDLLLQALKVFETEQGRLIWGGRFRYLLCDEHQDANKVQDRLLKELCGDHNNICVVGDEKQSIYRFRGAEVRNILRFESNWAGARVFHLEANYRSQANIITAANAVIEKSTERTDNRLVATRPAGSPVRLLTFETHWDEGRFVADRVKALIDAGISADSVAVAYRTNAQSQVLEEKLLERGISYRVVGGVEFNRRVEVQAVRAYLALLVNRRDRLAFERAIGWPKRGVGDTTAKLVVETARDSFDRDIRAAVTAVAASKPAGVNARAVTGLTEFAALLDRCEAAMATTALGEIVRGVVRYSGIEALLREGGETGRDQLANIDQLIGLAERYPGNADDSMAEFLEATALNETPEDEEREPAVTLMTLHATKGLEFGYVFLPGLEQELFLRPTSDPRDIEEARRLLYVGMTRAETELVMSLCESRRMWGRESFMRPLQFLTDLPAEVIRQRARTRPASPAPGAPRRPGRPGRPAPPRPGPPRRSRTAGGPSAGPLPASRDPLGAGQPARPVAATPADRFAAGQKVMHPSFGPGVVLSASGDRIRVRFPTATKELSIGYAKLTVL
jgi:DNA helicase-2/ATP-dependent DNA helicase PcrA